MPPTSINEKVDQPVNEMPDFGDHVDKAIFDQILEMDDGDDHEFSKELVYNFFDQASETFTKMDSKLRESNLDELSKLGHFLKGSSATLGFTKLRDNCQIIQQYGSKRTVDGAEEPDEKVCLKKITEALTKAKEEAKILEEKMRDYYTKQEDKAE